MEINWQEPPPMQTRKGHIDTLREILPALQANPGRWALITEDASVASITRWKTLFPGIEFTTRQGEHPRGRAAIYARATTKEN